MPYLPSLNAFLHSASQLLHAYPTARITTKYSLPKPSTSTSTSTAPPSDPNPSAPPQKTPAATLTAKIYHAQSGICLKYSTDKAQEVGRLFTSLGKLARGEAIDLPSAAAAGATREDLGATADKMEVDSGAGVGAVKVEDAVVTGKPVAGQGQPQQQGGGGGGGKGKKKKGKR